MGSLEHSPDWQGGAAIPPQVHIFGLESSVVWDRHGEPGWHQFTRVTSFLYNLHELSGFWLTDYGPAVRKILWRNRIFTKQSPIRFKSGPAQKLIQGAQKPGILREFSKPGKLGELSGISLQTRRKLATDKIVSLDGVSNMQKCTNVAGAPIQTPLGEWVGEWLRV